MLWQEGFRRCFEPSSKSARRRSVQKTSTSRLMAPAIPNERRTPERRSQTPARAPHQNTSAPSTKPPFHHENGFPSALKYPAKNANLKPEQMFIKCGQRHRADQGGKAWRVKRYIAGGGGSWRVF